MTHTLTTATQHTTVDLSSVYRAFVQIEHENVALLVHHAGASEARRRARFREEKFASLHLELTAAAADPLLLERPRKWFGLAPYGPSEEWLSHRLHNESDDFNRSQGNVLCKAQH